MKNSLLNSTAAGALATARPTVVPPAYFTKRMESFGDFLFEPGPKNDWRSIGTFRAFVDDDTSVLQDIRRAKEMLQRNSVMPRASYVKMNTTARDKLVARSDIRVIKREIEVLGVFNGLPIYLDEDTDPARIYYTDGTYKEL